MKIFDTREELFKILPKKMSVIELGVFKGDFSKFIYETMNPSNLYLIDIFEGIMGSGDKDGQNMQFVNLSNEYENIKQYFIDKPNVFVIKSTTFNFLSSIDDETIDLIYIDANHEYSSVKEDLTKSFNKIKYGGYICGHDYTSPRFDGVVKAVDEFCEEKKLIIDYITKDGCPTYCIRKKLKI